MCSGRRLYVVAGLLSLVCCISAQRYDQFIYMDSPTGCGTRKQAGDKDVFIVKPRGTVGVSNPPSSCSVTIESTFSGLNYKFEIAIEAAQFGDCSMDVGIYNGGSSGGGDIRTLGCGTSNNLRKVYSKDRVITITVKRLRDQYVFGNDFQLRIQLYYDTEAAAELTGTSSFPAGAIVGVVLGFIVLVTAAVLLAWCYKTGRLPGTDPYPYPATTKASSENLSRFETVNAEGNDNGTFVSWHNREGKSVTSDNRSNFDLSDSRIWDSLTNVGATTNKESLNVHTTKPAYSRRGVYDNNTDANRQGSRAATSEIINPNQMSQSPSARIRGRGRDYNVSKNDPYNTIGDDFSRTANDRDSNRLMKGSTFGKGDSADKENRRTSSGVFVNPDKEGYMYDYDQVKQLEHDKKKNSEEAQKTQDFASELQSAIKRASMRRSQSDNQTTDSEGVAEKADKSKDDSTDLSSLVPPNKHTDGEMTGPEAQSSPKPKKKKRKNSKERKSPKSSRKSKSTENSPKKSPRSRKRENRENEEDLPPEVFAPIFSGDEEPSTSMDYEHQYQPGYQGSYMPAAAPYDPRYPMGAYQPYPAGVPGMYPPGVPYQQAGQAQWFVEAQPNGQHKVAFAMQTHSQSDDSLQGHGPPNYTSTPYKHGGRPGDESALVPAGTILDDPRIPQPGTSVMRYDDDPSSGIKTSQVVWTDAKKDPTDPPPDSATQITRKTITRITTRSTEDQLQDAPDPGLQDMSWRAAQQIQSSGGQEPAFMSPSGPSLYNTHAIQYANQTPERSNASYYMGPHQGVASASPRQHHTGPPPPVIHEEPSRGEAFKDKITVSADTVV